MTFDFGTESNIKLIPSPPMVSMGVASCSSKKILEFPYHRAKTGPFLHPKVNGNCHCAEIFHHSYYENKIHMFAILGMFFESRRHTHFR